MLWKGETSTIYTLYSYYLLPDLQQFYINTITKLSPKRLQLFANFSNLYIIICNISLSSKFFDFSNWLRLCAMATLQKKIKCWKDGATAENLINHYSDHPNTTVVSFIIKNNKSLDKVSLPGWLFFIQLQSCKLFIQVRRSVVNLNNNLQIVYFL